MQGYSIGKPLQIGQYAERQVAGRKSGNVMELPRKTG